MADRGGLLGAGPPRHDGRGPARTVTDVQPATLARLVAESCEAFAGIKDASGMLTRVSEHRRSLGPDFVQLTGSDDLALAFNATGGVGCIWVTANISPELCASVQRACAEGDYPAARRTHGLLFPPYCALFSDASPGPAVDRAGFARETRRRRSRRRPKSGAYG